MSGSKYSNFDYDLSQKILTLLKVSLKFVFILIFPLHTLGMRQKLRERFLKFDIVSFWTLSKLGQLPQCGGRGVYRYVPHVCVCAASVAKRGICNISKVFNAHIWFLQAESLSNLSWGARLGNPLKLHRK